MKYVGVVIQGMVLDAKGVSAGDDHATVLQAAEAEAQKINEPLQESEGYVAIIVEVPES